LDERRRERCGSRRGKRHTKDFFGENEAGEAHKGEREECGGLDIEEEGPWPARRGGTSRRRFLLILGSREGGTV